jgi:hypothetical protein
MRASQDVVIYATASRIVRRVISPDQDGDLPKHQPHSGESRLLVAHGRSDPPSVNAAINKATGVTPPSARCCIVDASGNVIDTCVADPALDAGQLILSDTARPGDIYQSGVFLRHYAVVAKASNTVTAISLLPVDNPTVPAGSFLLEAAGRKVGDVVTVAG